MRISTKCSRAIHCLIFLAEYENQTKVTGKLLAKSTGCNPVIIPNILASPQKEKSSQSLAEREESILRRILQFLLSGRFTAQ